MWYVYIYSHRKCQAVSCFWAPLCSVTPRAAPSFTGGFGATVMALLSFKSVQYGPPTLLFLSELL